MNKSFSIYLDLVRFAAACLVYVWHSNNRYLTKEVPLASGYGHSAVVVFFVLSGFVIAYVTDTKEKTWTSYAASRLSRVYSVAVPALVLTVILDAVGRSLHPALYSYPFDQFAVRLVASFLMLNEIWLVSITSFSNVPYWSIAFEVWYYVIFGVAMFTPRRWRFLALLSCLLLVGPKILLLLPIWWSGVGLYRWERLQQISRGFAWSLVVVSVVGIIGFHGLSVYERPALATEALLGAALYRDLTFAKQFLADYLLAFLVCCNFAGMRAVASSWGTLLIPIEKPVRWVASFTFTLYLLHQPLMLFWASVVRGRPETFQYWSTVTLLTAASIVAVGYVTENRRHEFRTAIERLLQRLQERTRRKSEAVEAVQ